MIAPAAWMATLGPACGVAIVYFLAARLGLALLSKPSDVAVFWPASGVAAGILITFGRRVRPAVVIGVVVGTIAVNLTSDRSFLTSLFKGFCNAGEAVVAAWVLERWFGWPFTFSDLGRIAGFVGAAAFAAAASAFGGAATMTLLHTAAPFWDAWRTWFLSDWVGIVAIAPVVIGLGQAWREPPSREKWIEGVGVLALLALARLYVMDQPSDTWLSFNPSIVVLPQLLWLAARCPPVFVIVGVFFASIVVICATGYGIGRFGDASMPIMERVKSAQAVVSTGTIGILVLSSLFVQRKKAEEGLRQREAALGEAQRVGRIGSWYWDPKTDGIAGSNELLRIYGLDPAAQGALNFRDQRGRCYSVDDWERLHAAAQRTMQTGVGYEMDLRAFRNGTPIWVTTRGEAVRNDADQIVGIRGTVQDITERKLAEQALAERNLQLALAGRASLVGSYAYDADTEVVHVSEGYAAVHGFPEGTTKIARSQWLASVLPEDVELLARRRGQAFQQRQAEYSVDYRILLPGRGVRWIEARTFISYNDDGHPQRVVGVIIDATNRRQIEKALTDRNQQLELTEKVAQVGSYTYNYATRTLWFGPGSASIYGLQENSVEMPAEEWRKCVHPEDLPQLVAESRQALAIRQCELVSVFRILRGGEVRWVETRNRIIYDKAERATQATGICIDVTERRRAEDQKDLLVAELDHRVKNALACVAAIAQHAHEGSNTMEEFLDAFNGRIQCLANAHVLLSRTKWQGVSLAALVRGELASLMKDDNTDVQGPDIDLVAEAAQPIAMVLHELATNAGKYGALSNSHGRVSVVWEWQLNGGSSRGLAFEWRETGGPTVAAPHTSGYGSKVIRNLIPYELGGTVDYVLAPDGVRCRLEIPSKWLCPPHSVN